MQCSPNIRIIFPYQTQPRKLKSQVFIKLFLKYLFEMKIENHEREQLFSIPFWLTQ